jgi:5-hydroxyisourate hydrolase-like protein (transthyretin family)
MAALLLSLILLAQAAPPQLAGTIVGVLKDSSGKPAAGIRVAAVPRPESGGKVLAGGAAMSSQAETDAEGRYRLENVPPGRYFVAAGIIALPTFYPGRAMIKLRDVPRLTRRPTKS